MAKYLDKDGFDYFCGKLKVRSATDSSFGFVKTNSDDGIYLSDGQLNVDGRLGQMLDTNGLYSPMTISPTKVGKGSFMLTEATSLYLGDKSLGIVTGIGITLSTPASAGSTTYTVANTYQNRISCMLAINGTMALNETSSATSTAKVTSVTIGGSSFTPSSAADDASRPITITTDKSINPNSATSSIRLYASAGGFSSLFIGQCVGSSVTASGGSGASVVVGQRVLNKANASCIVGADVYSTGHGSAIFGRLHINTKNRVFLAGTGHDTTSGPSENVAAFGAYSKITSSTAFVVGNGTSPTARSNVFEVRNDGGIVLKSPNGTYYEVTVTNSGTLSVTAL